MYSIKIDNVNIIIIILSANTHFVTINCLQYFTKIVYGFKLDFYAS